MNERFLKILTLVTFLLLIASMALKNDKLLICISVFMAACIIMTFRKK